MAMINTRDKSTGAQVVHPLPKTNRQTMIGSSLTDFIASIP
jgi:hypothetical protein